jgi:hypothetical protein
MKRVILVSTLFFLLNSSCYGPALSQKYVCKDEQELGYREPDWGSLELICLISLQSPDNSNEQTSMATCAIYSSYMYEHQCDKASSIIPWWINL